MQPGGCEVASWPGDAINGETTWSEKLATLATISPLLVCQHPGFDGRRLDPHTLSPHVPGPFPRDRDSRGLPGCRGGIRGLLSARCGIPNKIAASLLRAMLEEQLILLRDRRCVSINVRETMTGIPMTCTTPLPPSGLPICGRFAYPEPSHNGWAPVPGALTCRAAASAPSPGELIDEQSVRSARAMSHPDQGVFLAPRSRS